MAILRQTGALKFCVALLLVALTSACSGSGGPPTTSLRPPPSAASESPTAAQPKLPTVRLWLGPRELLAEQALTISQITTGMMFRNQMGENEAMLFVFTEPHQASFWMRNTLLPLSCAYIDPNGVILEIHDMKPRDETPIQARSDRVQYVLETRQGWFQRNGIGVGTVVRTERGTLQDSYIRSRN
jgi:uncharacterized protein